MSDALIQIVDENDRPVGVATPQDAWDKGFRHRIARVMAFDKNGDVLLQKRQDDKFLYPDCWDPTAAGHVDEGEDYEASAVRELEEEMGISDAQLKEVAYYRTEVMYKTKQLYRFVKLYKTVVPRNIKVKIQKQEVSEAKWFSRQELDDLIKDHPDKISDGLQESYKKLF